MENDGIETNAVEEAQAVGKFVDLVEDSSANLDDGKLRGIGRV